MFGYIRPAVSSLTEGQQAIYKAAYCGLCFTGSEKLSRLSRFFLNYDVVLLSLVRTVLTEDTVTLKTVTKRCRYKLRKVSIFDVNHSQEYSVNAFFILLYFKLLDDLKDESFLKKIPKYMVRPIVKHIYKKAEKACPGLSEKIKEDLDKLYEKEQGNETSLDSLADGFGTALADISAYGIEDGVKREYAYNIGYHIGRFVYIIDALDDLDDDRKHGAFNALSAYYGSFEEAEKNVDSVFLTLKDSMICASNNLCLADKRNDIEELTHNIILYGSMNSFANVVKKNGLQV